MKALQKVLVFICIFMILCSMFGGFMENFFGEDASLNPFDYARITDVDYKAEVVDEPGGNALLSISIFLVLELPILKHFQ